MLHAVRLNERLTFKTFWLRQSETSSENTQKWPETTKRLQTVYRVIYHTRTIISQPKNANIVNVEFSLVKSILIFNLISFSLSLSYVASIFWTMFGSDQDPIDRSFEFVYALHHLKVKCNCIDPHPNFFFIKYPRPCTWLIVYDFQMQQHYIEHTHYTYVYCIVSDNLRISDRKTFTLKWMSYTWYKQFDLDRRRTTTGCPKINAIERL